MRVRGLNLGRVLLIVLLLALAAGPVSAAGKPIGGCPTGFTLRLASDFPFNEGDPGWNSIDGNGDGYTCLRPTPTPPWPYAAVLVDNTVKL